MATLPPGSRGLARLVTTLALVAALGCSADPSGRGDDDRAGDDPSGEAAGADPTPTATDEPAAPSPTPSPGASPSATPESTGPPPARPDVDRVVGHVEVLAGDIGPRLATAPAYREAARYVERRLRRQGYDVSRQGFPVPAGDSWGVPVQAGRSFNVVATPPGFSPESPYRLVGAHLDTVAVAPGAEDNASGVAVLLELARLAADRGTGLPTVLVAFGAEEPRGPTDADHHYGSQHYVREMGQPARDSLRAMVSLDRVGVGGRLPVCTGPLSGPRVRDDLLATARRLDVPADPCELTTSDHWSFEKAGHTVARLGSTPYAAYHSGRDLPGVLAPAQLRRATRVAWAWLR